jgi:hypothetical protein
MVICRKFYCVQCRGDRGTLGQKSYFILYKKFFCDRAALNSVTKQFNVLSKLALASTAPTTHGKAQ